MFTKNWYKLLSNAFADKHNLLSLTNSAGSSVKYDSEYSMQGNIAFVDILNDGIQTTATSGVHIGTGTTLPTVDDYCLSGDRITTFTNSNAITTEANDNAFVITTLYTITNTADTAITIGEIGVFGYTGNNNAVLLEHTVLESPITIEAGGVGQVTYTIRFNYPTA